MFSTVLYVRGILLQKGLKLVHYITQISFFQNSHVQMAVIYQTVSHTISSFQKLYDKIY